jgi:hypothetical protein
MTTIAPSSGQSYDAFVRSVSNVADEPVAPVSSSASLPITFFDNLQDLSDPRFTEEAFRKRFKENAPLALFGMSAYQVRPGEPMTFQGTGFLDENEIHFDSNSVSAASADGFTLSGSAPGQVGIYEVWVTNKKGSTQSSDRMIKLTVTDNPAPLPVVVSISPATPAYGDTVTVSGSGFSNSNTVSTSLGPILGVSSNGSAFQFRISDLPIAPLIKDKEGVKGKLISVQMYVQSDGGITKTAFDFNVQF